MAITSLRCGHTAIYEPRPTVGAEVYCRRCNAYTKVAISVDEWSWHCPACHYSRSFGADEAGTYHSARRHQRKHHHVVLVRKGYDVKDTMGPEGQNELSVAEERIQWVKQTGHQSSLKALVEKTIVQSGRSTMDRQG
jgi:transposase-like protein